MLFPSFDFEAHALSVAITIEANSIQSVAKEGPVFLHLEG